MYLYLKHTRTVETRSKKKILEALLLRFLFEVSKLSSRAIRDTKFDPFTQKIAARLKLELQSNALLAARKEDSFAFCTFLITYPMPLKRM